MKLVFLRWRIYYLFFGYFKCCVFCKKLIIFLYEEEIHSYSCFKTFLASKAKIGFLIFFSNSTDAKEPAEWWKFFSKNIGLAFELIVQSLVHTFIYCTIFPFFVYCFKKRKFHIQVLLIQINRCFIFWGTESVPPIRASTINNYFITFCSFVLLFICSLVGETSVVLESQVKKRQILIKWPGREWFWLISTVLLLFALHVSVVWGFLLWKSPILAFFGLKSPLFGPKKPTFFFFTHFWNSFLLPTARASMLTGR